MSDVLERLSAALSDRYTIDRELGAGGMATVYLAEDLKHDRKVALKVLKPELAAVLGADRFVQEIKTTASLQHPHILPLFDSGQADGFLYYVMPYIEGETLRDKLDRETQLGIDEAIRITTEVADALDYAHRNGVIHRDIKPENILLHDGRPMVADFGIALAVSAAAGGRMTETGLSLGTPHYMSPEQATAEKDITNRSDMYSLAAVLYEMLAGDPPHTGSTAQQIIMKIVTEGAAPVTKVRKSVPPNVTAAVSKALEKLPADRFESAKTFAEALTNPAFTTVSVHASDAGSVGTALRWNRLTVALAAVAALTTLTTLWGWLQPRSEPVSSVRRYMMSLPEGEEIGGWFTRLALSPDGSRLVYIHEGAGGDRELLIRDRNQLHARRLAGTKGAEVPFFSPDGESVGFVSPRGTIKVVPVEGGEAVPVARTQVGYAGASWGSDGFIYADANEGGGLVRVRANGGTPEPFTQLDTARAEREHIWPQVLPDGNGVLFVIKYQDDQDLTDIAVADVATGRHTVLVPGLYARYAASGHLVYVTWPDRTVRFQPFDPQEMTLHGEAGILPEEVWLGAVGAPHFVPDLTISLTGTLMSTSGGGQRVTTDVVWVSRDGTVRQVDPAWTDQLGGGGGGRVMLSPDGTQLAVTLGAEVWIKQLDRGSLTKLTFEGGFRPEWSPDGRFVAFISGRDGRRKAYQRRADGTGSAELMLEHNWQVHEVVYSPDGEWLVHRIGGGGEGDLYAVRTDGEGDPVPLVVSHAQESHPALSPNGRWLAYMSLETGRPEIWVRPFPNAQDGSWMVSPNGGSEPAWAHSGKELFYRDGNDDLVSVAITEGSTFIYGEPRVLFSVRDYVSSMYRQEYTVAPDDQRFIFVRRLNETRPHRVLVIDNLFADLNARGGR
jgi:serine/threonine-protein kinase